MVAASQDVEIYDNTLVDNFNGITLIQQDRGAGSLGSYLLRNVSVRGNDIVRSGRTGVVQDIGDPSVFTARNLRFQDNDYEDVAGFSWADDESLSWPEWRSYGMDLAGSIS
jgi:hypothetical protein